MAASKRLRYEVLRRDNHTCQYCGRSAPDVELHVDHVIPVALGGRDEPSNLKAACRDCNSGKGSMPPDYPTVPSVTVGKEVMAQAFRDAYAANLKDPKRGDEIMCCVRSTLYDEFMGCVIYIDDEGTWGDDNHGFAVVTEVDDDGEASRGFPFATRGEAEQCLADMEKRQTPPLPDDAELRDLCNRWYDAGVGHLSRPDMWYLLYRAAVITHGRKDQLPKNVLFRYFAGVVWNRIRALQEAAQDRIEAGVE